jgi:hypothetical protein
MTDIPDYIETLGVRFRFGAQGCGVSLTDHDGEFHGGGLFQDIELSELRSKLNEATHIAAMHYTECIAQAGAELTRSQIMAVSFRVIIYILVHRNMDKRASRQPGGLSIDIADLRSAVARTRCWIYCESKFPSDYQFRTAALMEMSLGQFQKYELDHRPLMLDLGLLR